MSQETQVRGHPGLSHVLLCPSHNVLCMLRSSALPLPTIQMGSQCLRWGARKSTGTVPCAPSSLAVPLDSPTLRSSCYRSDQLLTHSLDQQQ